MQKAEKVREFLLSKVKAKVDEAKFEDLSFSESLIAQGVFDSLDFITLLMELESSFDIELDFDDIEPAQFTSIDGLIQALFQEEATNE